MMVGLERKRKQEGLLFFPHLSSAFIISNSQEVCRHMDSVFKELLSRQVVQNASSSTSSPSAQAPQRKGRWDGRSRRWAGLFKAAKSTRIKQLAEVDEFNWWYKWKLKCRLMYSDFQHIFWKLYHLTTSTSLRPDDLCFFLQGASLDRGFVCPNLLWLRHYEKIMEYLWLHTAENGCRTFCIKLFLKVSPVWAKFSQRPLVRTHIYAQECIIESSVVC